MRDNPIRFVADGFGRLSRSPEYRALEESTEIKVRAHHAAALSETKGFWARQKIERRIKAEVRVEMAKLGSPDCLWISRSF